MFIFTQQLTVQLMTIKLCLSFMYSISVPVIYISMIPPQAKVTLYTDSQSSLTALAATSFTPKQ